MESSTTSASSRARGGTHPSTTTTSPSAAAGAAKVLLCPYCGQPQRSGVGEDVERCKSCGGLFEPLSQIATQIAMGPWYIRDKQQPFRPGCSYDVLRKMLDAGRIRPTSVMRGPTTRQFWQVARNVPGVAHFLGYCHNCNFHVKPTDAKCPSCGAAFKEPDERDRLGLQFPTPESVERAERDLAAAREAQRTGKPTDVVIRPAVEGRPTSKGTDSGGVTSLAATMGGAATQPAAPVRRRTGEGSLLADALGDPPASASPTPAPRPTTTTAARPIADGQALDFGPSEEAAAGVSYDEADALAIDPDHEHEHDHDHDPLAMTPLVWVLAALNVAMLALVTLLGALLWQA